ncbi:hypothetical protein K3181_15365 [Qipengyuania sp. YG27]|uniref:Uncharacterized protein n=1 Tax=Qipengyuania mesophila TaxID=2867246 RepID=A0ABS7JYT6_9SPHN|nr:hypothetical protein [Qipengyuania mesophila]MBX7502819.1 hypothetical protein [Qipengyuania mesophila]
MKSSLAIFTAIVAVAALPTEAIAQAEGQQQVGSRFERKPDKSPDRYAKAFIEAFKHCYYKNYPERADNFLIQTDAYSEERPKGTIDRLTLRPNKWSAGCQYDQRGTAIESTLSFNTRALRYMMAEAAYLYRFPDAPPAGMSPDSQATAPNWNVSRRYVSTGENLGKARFFGDFADCIVAKDPRGADRLVRSEIRSSEERAAAMGMVDALGDCLVAGHELELTPANIRSFAADGLWQRYVVDARVSPAKEAAE